MLCNQRNHELYNIFDKQIYYSENFCTTFEVEFKDLSWFINYELVKYFETFRNYVLCYKERNFLLATNVYKFIFDREILKDISNCREKQDCNDFCHRYSHTKLPTTFIGNIDHLEEIHNFLRKNPVSTDGFMEPEEEESQK